MADEDSSQRKPGIPAWQRAQTKQQDTNAIEIPSVQVEEEISQEAQSPPTSETPPEINTLTQEEQVKTFLQDPAVKDEPTEKKRAFLESKGISNDLIDQTLGRNISSIRMDDFESFKQQQTQSLAASQPPPPSQLPPQPSSPPIITYPEFLVEAHKPPPLITPTRIINTAYIASGIAALLYGASKYLVSPMSMTLNDARHDFSQHSQGKLDEMNSRLEKLVSVVPSPKPSPKHPDGEADDTENDSITSDPTELYHRDIGTQTSPADSRSSSPDTAEKKKQTPTAYQTRGLEILHSHLSELHSAAENLTTSYQSREDALDKLRLQIDSMTYTPYNGYARESFGTPYLPYSSSTPTSDAEDGSGRLWSGTSKTEKVGQMQDERKKEMETDVIEELKKEIRGVKGVLLSAKRFPGVTGRSGVAVGSGGGG